MIQLRPENDIEIVYSDTKYAIEKVQREDIDPKFQLEEFNVMQTGQLFNNTKIS